MADENLYCAQPQHGPLDEPGAAEHQVMQTPMNAKLTDNDRRAVDFLLDGEEPSQENNSPMARNAFMDRVQAVRRLLSLLDAMPAEAPSTELVEATLAHTPLAGQAEATDTTGSQPTA